MVPMTDEQIADLRKRLATEGRNLPKNCVPKLLANLDAKDAEIAALRARCDGLTKENECHRALALLIAQDDIFLSPPQGCVFIRCDDDKPTTEGFAVSSWNIGDTFAFACADSEPFSLEEAPAMLALATKEGWPGVVRWCAERRKARGEVAEPIPPVKKRMAEIDRQREKAEAAESRSSRLAGLLDELWTFAGTDVRGDADHMGLGKRVRDALKEGA